MNNPEDDVFYFETDHLALRGNKDYSEVLKTLVILCAQREKAAKNHVKAIELRKAALEDPSKVLEKIVKGESLGMPDMHNIPEIPVIDWSKHNVKIPEETLKEIYSGTSEGSKKKHESPQKEQKASHGLWTAEEQKRLEELLQIYPPEPVELRRFKKIANALGNRTIQQVTSRVQKYFLKLYKAGLPIPGRIPKSAERYKRTALHKHQRHNHYLWKPTTFFPDLCVPVLMDDLESVPGPSSKTTQEISQPSTSATNYLLPTNYHQENEGFCTQKSETELQLDLLKRIRKVKLRSSSDTSPFRHLGYKCDYCSEEPIIGTRWHCVACKTESIDFCTDCVLGQMYSDNCHPLTHSLVSFCDKGNYFSDSESNTGSGPGSLKQANESSDSSDSEFNDNGDRDGEDEEGNEDDQAALNGAPSQSSEGLNDFEAGLHSEPGLNLFSDIEIDSYDYVNSDSLFD